MLSAFKAVAAEKDFQEKVRLVLFLLFLLEPLTRTRATLTHLGSSRSQLDNVRDRVDFIEALHRTVRPLSLSLLSRYQENDTLTSSPPIDSASSRSRRARATSAGSCGCGSATSGPSTRSARRTTTTATMAATTMGRAPTTTTSEASKTVRARATAGRSRRSARRCEGRGPGSPRSTSSEGRRRARCTTRRARGTVLLLQRGRCATAPSLSRAASRPLERDDAAREIWRKMLVRC